ncbi:3-phosphoshikimate 1-carboxyvinyltransferase [Thalassobacillus sp. CUG 92003]|uniref:3-phosphoshikimate 1-carboxyvinyltransferase n=1 Tax=Thalassobacillus sp. CUG 92003 TaxID=2736641 RepID=UPI0015E70418|nr:3-phosphoshikimate 1-carboxyvinyltransferase [Thalassobacillus sp. CUG 92003]
MSVIELHPHKGHLKGELTLPGDKSISHRAAILSSLATGRSVIDNFLMGEDCLRTVKAFEMMGVMVVMDERRVVLDSPGLHHLYESEQPIYFGNSGTTARLMTGVLSALPLFSTVYGDASLTKRPMDRVVQPLSRMGAEISGRAGGSLLPLAIQGGQLKGMVYDMPVKSAQVKTALLLAGMLGDGETTIIEKTQTRDHTERLLPRYQIDIEAVEGQISIQGGQVPKPADITVPGDISSAAFFLVAASIIPDSRIVIRDCGLNPTRTGIIQALEVMGASLQTDVKRTIAGEPIGDIIVESASLQGATIEGDLIANLIDEVPIIALAATQAHGTTVIKDAKELRVKETDRIEAVAHNLQQLGAHVKPLEDGLEITGPTPLTGGHIHSYHDHRIGMMGAIASLICSHPVTLTDFESINTSYPGFFDVINSLMQH